MTFQPRGRSLLLAPPIALATLLALATVSPEAVAGKPACGAPGKPPCPMQRWMRTHLAVAYAQGDFVKLATALDKVVELNPRPNKWGNWNGIARKGAAAARKRDKRAALLSCTNCHRVYRRTYNLRYRERTVPD
jgi:hypothetical protein